MTNGQKSANDIVKLARAQDRPTSLDYIEHVFEDFIELHGDRTYGDDKAIVGGIATLEGQPVTVVGIQKGRNLPDNIERNFGSPHPEGYRKALRLMKQAEKFGRPIVLLVNTAGAFCGVEAEERGEGEAIAKNLLEMSDLRVPIISIIIGEGGSGGALALALADEVWMLEHTMYAILSPEGFASIMWKDSKRASEAAEIMKITATELKELDVIDKLIPETFNGEDLDQEKIDRMIQKALVEKLTELKKLTVSELLVKRYERFRKF
ncbi:acetyl-CoA carboxylase carboxyl transferase subunit alpha [Vagococcus entomophilus]|uniref:Acetyl-coenzyme A carboxylase carboxyl transferase subunit alpha n=1 Tax=Vagococcus entomophilus TaxID=1160095 RepID=A0A430AJI7_9ENTE|nr:acetyl-CoA carboxylase carboxyl transferase subunit alpha [Vagococcus entomophilus]RSU08276.1 acetyl-CoA carboxylase carboxyl transferase subunit alpha [Vagococcus entomophilus]